MTTPTTDLAAVAEAIRAHDRFLLVTHENPDGDALGSILGMKLGLDSLGKDSVMFLPGQTSPPGEYAFLPLEGLLRELPADGAERVLLALDCANAKRMGAAADLLDRVPLSIDVDHHHDNTRFATVNHVIADASSTGEIVRDLLRELDVPLDAGDRRSALRRTRHRHRPLPVHEHDPEGAASRRRAGRSGRRRPARVPRHLRVGRVREGEAPRPRARTGAGVRRRPARRLLPAAERLPRARRGGGVRRRDHRLPPVRRRRSSWRPRSANRRTRRTRRGE